MESVQRNGEDLTVEVSFIPCIVMRLPTSDTMLSKRQFIYHCAGCALGLSVTSLLARDGVEVGKTSGFAKLVPAEQVEGSANQQYAQMLKQAKDKNALAPDDHPEVIRLRAIAQKLIPYSYEWNPRAKDWKWEINLIGSAQINAFCMPGGKIAFYHGILDKLQLTEDEVAMVMGHEIAHALREHARERMGKSEATNVLATIGSALASEFTDAEIQPRRRKRGRSGGHGTGCARRLRPAFRCHALAKNERRQQGRATAVVEYTPLGQHPHQRD